MKYILVLSVLTLVICSGSCKHRQIGLEEFEKITYKYGPVAANRAPATIITVSYQNDTARFKVSKHFKFVSKVDGEMKGKKDVLKSGGVSRSKLIGLIATINSNNFMGLGEKYRDPEILDGDVESLRLELKDTTRQVVLVNVSNERFDAVAEYLETIVVGAD